MCFGVTFLLGVSDNDVELLLVIQSNGILRFLDSLPLLPVVQLVLLHLIGGLVTGVVTSLLMWSLFFVTTSSSLILAGCWEQLLSDDDIGEGVFGGRTLKHPYTQMTMVNNHVLDHVSSVYLGHYIDCSVQ